VNPKGKEALGKLAAALNANPEITIDIEGHTDSIPIRGRYQDNWDLSTAPKLDELYKLLEANPDAATTN
jgi:chemotaxis protein MotB